MMTPTGGGSTARLMRTGCRTLPSTWLTRMTMPSMISAVVKPSLNRDEDEQGAGAHRTDDGDERGEEDDDRHPG